MKKLFAVFGILAVFGGSAAWACPLSGGGSAGSASSGEEVAAESGEAHHG